MAWSFVSLRVVLYACKFTHVIENYQECCVKVLCINAAFHIQQAFRARYKQRNIGNLATNQTAVYALIAMKEKNRSSKLGVFALAFFH
jgi:hypothetical protein